MENKKRNQKKRYDPPRIESRDVYEVNALACAKCANANNISLSSACIRGNKKFS
ncbi:MAG: hypothetical protein GY853_12990 [PVC group bacterium]|nr:hypothetical protein [PVC group bacterium]